MIWWRVSGPRLWWSPGRCNVMRGSRRCCGVRRRAVAAAADGEGRARGRNASFSHREKRMRLSVAGTQWRRDEIRFAGGAGAGTGALIDSRRATAGRLRRIGDSSGPIKLPAVEESCSATHARETIRRARLVATASTITVDQNRRNIDFKTHLVLHNFEIPTQII